MTVSVGDLVWNDLNSNGAQEAGEPGVAGAAVELFSSTDTTIGNADDVSRGQAITDANGHYSFANLPVGLNYYLIFRAPVGYAFSPRDQGGDDTKDSDVVQGGPSAGQTAMFTVSAGGNRTDLDAGLTGAAPVFGWACQVGAAGDEWNSEWGEAIAVDPSGNLYVSITLADLDVDLDPGPGVHTTNGSTNGTACIAKYTSAGALLWAKPIGGDYARCHSLVVADNGFLYGAGSIDLSTVWIFKSNSSGDLVWSQSMPSDSGADVFNIAVSTDGGVYATGWFGSTVDFDPGPGNHDLTTGDQQDIFVLRLDAQGDFVWARQMEGGGWGDTGRGIAVAPDGGVCITGEFYGTVDFDPGSATYPLTSAAEADIFVVKLNASGGLVWAKAMTGGGWIESGQSIAIAPDATIAIAGYFYPGTDFDPGSGEYALASAGDEDAFVAKLDAAGNLLWARAVGGGSQDYASSLALAEDGSICVTGHFQYTADFDRGTEEHVLTSVHWADAFVLRLDSAGEFVSVDQLGGQHYQFGQGIALYPAGVAYVVGTFGGTADFDPGVGTYSLSAAGEYDAFIVRLGGPTAQAPAVTVNAVASVNEGTAFSTNGSFSDPDSAAWTATVDYGEGGGQQPLALNPDKTFTLSHTYTDNGTYTITVRVSDGIDVGTAQTSVEVANVAPTAELQNNGPVEAGSPATVSFANAMDPSAPDTAAGFHYSYALAETGLAADYLAAIDDASKQFTFSSGGAYTIYGRIFDKDNGSTTYTTAVNVAQGPRAIYVDVAAAGPVNDGSSWSTAYLDVQQALAAAAAGDTVLVATGTYTPTSGTDRTTSFALKNGVAVHGGYAGSTAPDPDARDVFANVTVLSGDIGTTGNASDNSFHVVVGSGTDASAVLDGFTVTAGNANGTGDGQNSGGGMYNVSGSPTISNCVFSVNASGATANPYGGGGMYNFSSSPVLTNCTFTGNNAIRGGGMYNYSASSPTLTSCDFANNTVSSPSSNAYGAGMYNYSSSPSLTNCTFNVNTAIAPASGMSAGGGGMVNTASSSPSLTTCRFTGNSATSSGGSGYGAGVYNVNSSSPTLTNCQFTRNSVAALSSAYGAGMHNGSSSPILSNCTFSGNTVSVSTTSPQYASGGAAVNNTSGAAPTLTNCIFVGNVSTTASNWSQGGAMSNYSAAAPRLINCTFANNLAKTNSGTSSFGGAIYSHTDSGTAVAVDTIIWGNTAVNGAQIFDNGKVAVTYSDIQNGFSGTGNISTNPLFARSPGPGTDGNWGTADDDYGDLRLQWSSPAIDVGSNAAVPPGIATDLAGNPRIFNASEVVSAVVDLGAYEFPSLIHDVTWSKAGDGDWNNPANWDRGHVPTSADRAIIPNPTVTVTSSGNATVQRVLCAGNLSLTGGVLTVTGGESYITGTLAIAPGASLAASGTGTSLVAAGVVTANAADLSALSGAILAFPGLTTASGSTHFWALGGTIDLSALEILGSVDHCVVGALSDGTVLLSPLAATVSNVDLIVAPTGTIRAGILLLSTGSTLSGTGTVEANVVNSAVVRPGNDPALVPGSFSGILTIHGDYAQTGSGRLEIGLGGLTAGTQFDRLEVTGTAALDGTSRVSLIDDFQPEVGNVFRVINAASTSGQFAVCQGFIVGDDVELRPSYDPSGTTLTAVVRVAPIVTAVSPAGMLAAAPGHLDVTFSKAMDANTFTAADVTVTGPGGAVNVLDVQLLTGMSATYRCMLDGPLADGVYSVRVGPDVQDLAGNWMDQDGSGTGGEASDVFLGGFTLDTTPPGAVDELRLVNDTGTSALDGLTNAYALAFSWIAPHDATDIAGYEYQWDGGDWTATADTSVSLSAEEGEHVFAVRAVDGAGNAGDPSSLAVTVDRTPPSTVAGLAMADDTGMSDSDRVTSDATPEFSWPAADDANGVWEYQYRVDGSVWTDTADLFAAITVGNGGHVFGVCAVDTAGNAGPETSWSWITDLVGPTMSGLTMGDDTGSSATDGITSDMTPGFDWSASDSSGIWRYQYQWDSGPWTDTTELTATFSASEGPHTFAVRGVDVAGNVGAAATKSIVVDTTSPVFEGGPAREQAPLARRTVVFSEPIDPASVTLADVSLAGPSGPISGRVASVETSGNNVVVHFTAGDPLTELGPYQLSLGTRVADLAGNPIAAPPHDAFVLRSEIVSPAVLSVGPTDWTTEDLNGFDIVFSEPLAEGTFTLDDVSLSSPAGSIPPSAMTLTALAADRYRLDVPQQSAEGSYVLRIGPNVLDPAGNPMDAAHVATLVIDRAPPAVLSISPAGTLRTAADHVDVWFSEAMARATFTAADIILSGPTGPIFVEDLVWLADNACRVLFNPRWVNGTYAVSISADAADLAGNRMLEGAVAQFTLDLPSDPYYAGQWTAENTGQTQARADADIDLPGAWNITSGSADIVVAVLDNGVDLLHRDLHANIFVNPLEIPGNGIDDDGNGWIDDVSGWDFRDGDNNANPAALYDNHGTHVAGILAALANDLGLRGAAPNVKILPVKIAKKTTMESDGYASAASIADAIYYAAGRAADGQGTWRGADVIVCSWTYSIADPAITAALDWAASQGRNGLGVPIFCAAGNNASDYEEVTVNVAPGTWVFDWRASAIASPAAAGTMRLANVRLPDGTVERFEQAALPAGWSTSLAGGPQDTGLLWQVVADPAHAHGTSARVAVADLNTAVAGSSTTSRLLSRPVLVMQNGALSFQAWNTGTAGQTLFHLYGSKDGGPAQLLWSGAAPLADAQAAVAYPAGLASTIAVGASTDWDLRADYSQYGAALDLVAPSSGGNAQVMTTDRSGMAGVNTSSGAAGDYYPGFGGTSAAAPLAAGVAALMLSVNADLTAAQIRHILSDTADKIGPVAYAEGRNDFYGHGRINAAAAVRAALPPGAGVIITCDGNLALAEGGAAQTYGMALAVQPTHEVVVRLLSDAQVAAVDDAHADRDYLIFTPDNWHVPQRVRVWAADDRVIEAALGLGIVNHAVASADPRYQGITVADVPLPLGDNDGTPASVGDRVFSDLDHDGVQDATEPGLAGATVRLYWAGADGAYGGGDDQWVATRVSSPQGQYGFTGITPGAYYLEFVLPAGSLPGSRFSDKDQGGDDGKDSDVDPSTCRTDVFALAGGQTDASRDAGVMRPSSAIGDRVWNDVNRNGIQDAAEPGVGGARVDVYYSPNEVVGDEDDLLWKSTTTDNEGNYAFSDLNVGLNYYMVFHLPSGGAPFWFSPESAGTDDALDSDADSLGQTAMFVPQLEHIDLSLDAGMVEDSPLHFAFARQLGGGSLGLAAAALPNGGACVLGTLNGAADLDPGEDVWELTSAGVSSLFLAEYSAAGTPRWAGFVGVPRDGASYLTASGVARAADGSLYVAGHFHGSVNFDPAGGGLALDAAGTAAYLSKFDSDGLRLWTKIVNNDAATLLDGISAGLDGAVYLTGRFQGTIDFAPGPHNVELTAEGGSDAFVCKFAPDGSLFWAKEFGGSGTDNVAPQAIAVGDEGTIYLTGAFSGTADLAPGGAVANRTSAGGKDVFIMRLDPSGDLLWAESLGGAGEDEGRSLAPSAHGGVYVGGQFTATVDFDPGAGSTNMTAGGTASFLLKLDTAAGFAWARKPAGDRVMVDALDNVYAVGNGASKYDAAGWPQATIDLPGANVAGGAVALDGSIYLTGSFVGTCDFDPGGGANRLTADGPANMFLVKLSQAPLAGILWNDFNRNGLQDPEEPRFAGAAVDLCYSANDLIGDADDVVMATTQADSLGRYFFATAVPGMQYYLTFHRPPSAAGYGFTARAAGSPVLDSDADPQGRTPLFTWDAGGPMRDFDAGLSVTALGNVVWEDKNGDGLQGAGEPGLRAVRVEARAALDDSLLAATTTAADGHYLLENVAASEGGCYLKFILPSGFRFTRADAGGDETLDSDADPTTGHTAVFDVAAGMTDLNWDAGLIAETPPLGNVLSAGSSGADEARAVAVDGAGNTINVGNFHGTIDIAPGRPGGELTSQGGYDIYVGKRAQSGLLLWARSFGAAGDDRAMAVAVASDGSVFLTGTFSGTIDFAPEDPDSGALVSHGPSDVFIVKLDRDGRFVWAQGFGGEEADEGLSIAADGEGRAYVTGGFRGPMRVGQAPRDAFVTGSGDLDVFAACFEASGSLAWARGMGGSGADEGRGIAVADEGLYLTGTFQDTISFEPGTEAFDRQSAGASDLFLARLDLYGSLTWVHAFGGAENDAGNSVAADGEGNVYATGSFRGEVDFDPGPESRLLSSAAGSEDLFAVKFAADGSLLWAQSIGGSGDDRANAIVLDGRGGVYLTGSFSGNVDFDPTPDGVRDNESFGASDLFSLKLDEAGNYRYVRTVGGISGDEEGLGLAVDRFGRLYTAGVFNSAQVFVDPADPKPVGDNSGDKDPFEFDLPEPATISNWVWKDSNNNGIQDEGEFGVRGVMVELFDANDDRRDWTYTDVEGLYLFPNVSAGKHYYVKFTLPSGYQFVAPNSGSNDAEDSDADAEGKTPQFQLASPNDYTDKLDCGLRTVVPNVPPLIANLTVAMAEYQGVPMGGNLITLAGVSDPDANNSGLSVSRTQDVAHGSLALSLAGNFTYTPAPEFYGSDFFTYEVRDSQGGTASGRVDFTVHHVPPDTIRAGSGNASIRVACSPGNPDSRDVFFNNPSSLPNRSLVAAGYTQWNILGGPGNDSLAVDFSGGNPLLAEGLCYSGGGGSVGDAFHLIGTGGNDQVTLTATEVLLNGYPSIQYSAVRFFGFDLGGQSTVVLDNATVSINRDNAISNATTVSVRAGSVLDLNGRSETIGALVLAGGTVRNGQLQTGSCVLDTGTITASLRGSLSVVKDSPGILSLGGSNRYTGGTSVLAGTLVVAQAEGLPPGGRLTIGAGGTVVLGGGIAWAAGQAVAEVSASVIPDLLAIMVATAVDAETLAFVPTTTMHDGPDAAAAGSRQEARLRMAVPGVPSRESGGLEESPASPRAPGGLLSRFTRSRAMPVDGPPARDVAAHDTVLALASRQDWRAQMAWLWAAERSSHDRARVLNCRPAVVDQIVLLADR